MNTPIRDCPQPDYQIRERAYTPAQTQAREYAAIQALADRRTVGQRRADVEAWRKPAPQRRRIDAQPQDTGLIGQWFTPGVRGALAYAALWALCIGITMLMVTATGHALVEAIRSVS